MRISDWSSDVCSSDLLKPTKIRGVESNGMMCSERELELSNEHEGIIELPGTWAVGTPASEALGANDPVIDIAITPNRPRSEHRRVGQEFVSPFRSRWSLFH